MSFTVAIVGRPNVGKSTLFNRLIGKRLAIVDDTPGVTRDRREGRARLGDMEFDVFDTAGLEEAFDDSLEARMRQQTQKALEDADVALMLVDARAGLTPMDEHFAAWLRGIDIPTVLLANKCEGKAGEAGRLEAYALGLGDPLPLSAEHGDGLVDLFEALQPFYDDAMARQAQSDYEAGKRQEEEKAPAVDEEFEGIEQDDPTKPLQLAIVGRPNVGKSTLINRLIGEDRMLTGPEAGITRDSIGIEWEYKGRAIKLFDTAGLRRRAKVTSKIETLSAADTVRAVQYAQVVVLVLDADAILEKQDLTIARRVIDEGRALVIAVNKWDAVADRNEALGRLNDKLQTSLPQIKGIPVVTLSALTGKGADRLLPTVMKAYEQWNRRISTSKLNRWLQAMTEAHPPPLAKGRRLRVRYVTQAKTRPPTFMLWVSQPSEMPGAYLRYLENGLREDFNLWGVPLRLEMRKGKNPYAK